MEGVKCLYMKLRVSCLKLVPFSVLWVLICHFCVDVKGAKNECHCVVSDV